MTEFTAIVSAVDIRRIVITAVLILALLVARWLIIRLIRHGAEILNENQRKWISQVRNGLFVVALVGLVFIWLPEIETFALSITAVAVAFVIATKELILCVSGTIYRASTNLFQVGDWIEVGPHFGEVVDQNVASTVIQEVDREDYVFTGHSVSVPNSMLFTHPVINHSFQKRYVFHSFEIITDPDANPFEAIPRLVALLKELSQDFSEAAARYNALVERRTGIDIPGSEPRFTVQTNEIGKQVLKTTIFCPTDKAANIQFAITEAYFGWYYGNRAASAEVLK